MEKKMQRKLLMRKTIMKLIHFRLQMWTIQRTSNGPRKMVLANVIFNSIMVTVVANNTQPHLTNKNLLTQQQNEINLEPRVTKENSSFVFVHTAQLESELNFAHLRTSLSLKDLITLKDQVCQHLMIMRNVSKSLIKLQLTPNGKVFTTVLTTSMELHLQNNCERARERIILTNEIFTRHFKRESVNTKVEVKAETAKQIKPITPAQPHGSIPSALPAAEWLATGNVSCKERCEDVNQICSPEGFEANNIFIDSERELRRAIQEVGGTTYAKFCTKGHSYSNISPSFSIDECNIPATDREYGTNDCEQPPPNGLQKLCVCHVKGKYPRAPNAPPPMKNAHCFQGNLDRYGADVNIDPADPLHAKTRGDTESARECQDLCKSREDCEVFTYAHNTKNCYLKTNQARFKANINMTSGPKVCPSQDQEVQDPWVETINRIISPSSPNDHIVTSTSEPHNKRAVAVIAAVIAGAAAAGSLALGAYNAAEMQKLSSEMDQVEQQIDHIIVALDRITELITENSQDIEQLQSKVNQITQTLNNLKGESQLMALAHHMTDISNHQLDTLENIVAGIFDCLTGKVSAYLLNGKHLREAFEMIRAKSAQRGFEMTQQEVIQLFQLPVSVILHQSNKADFVLHIPLKVQGMTMEVLRLESLPFQIESIPDRSYLIKTQNRYLGANARKTSLIELSQDDLAKCSKVQKTLFCPDLTQKLAIPENSCIISLYRDQQQNILDSCELMLAKTRTKLVRATHFQSFLATQGTKIFYKCQSARNKAKVKTGSMSLQAGTYRIETNPRADCIVSSQTFSYRAYSPLEQTMKFEPIAIQSNFMQLLNLTTEQVKQGIDLLQIHKSQKPMKLSEIRKEINTAKNARMAKTKVNQMFIVIATIGSIVILIVIGLTVTIG